jgi:GDPmannose 4,6-dehydratase
MWMMLQDETPSDYVLATGTAHKLSEFIEMAFQYFDLDFEKYVMVNKKFLRPNEPHKLCGDASKARKLLGWKPSLSFAELIYEMCKSVK